MRNAFKIINLFDTKNQSRESSYTRTCKFIFTCVYLRYSRSTKKKNSSIPHDKFCTQTCLQHQNYLFYVLCATRFDKIFPYIYRLTNDRLMLVINIKAYFFFNDGHNYNFFFFHVWVRMSSGCHFVCYFSPN